MNENTTNLLMSVVVGIVICIMFVSCNANEKIQKKYYIDKLKIQYQISDPNQIGN